MRHFLFCRVSLEFLLTAVTYMIVAATPGKSPGGKNAYPYFCLRIIQTVYGFQSLAYDTAAHVATFLVSKLEIHTCVLFVTLTNTIGVVNAV